MSAGASGLEKRFSRKLAASLARVENTDGKLPALAVALSGGGDSLALTALVAGWARNQGREVLALTVDHGLRPGSREEAQRAGEAARALGVKHRLLIWEKEALPERGLQAKARGARYRLLAEACREAGIGTLLLAHTLDDQAETFLLRLEGRSDLPGLACMAEKSVQGGLTLLRPLLTFSGAELRAWLAEQGLGWSEDPSNRDRRFSRVRLRTLLPHLAAEGVTPELLSATAADLSRLRARLEVAVSARLEEAAAFKPEGYIEAGLETLMAPPREIAGWALSRCLRSLGSLSYPPRSERLERLLTALGHPDFTGATLGGCRLLRRQERLLILREAAALPLSRQIEGAWEDFWDGRFQISLTKDAKGFRLAALGREGWRDLRREAPLFAEKIKAERGVPLPAIETLPALFDARGLAEAPVLGWRRADLTRSLCRAVSAKLLIPL